MAKFSIVTLCFLLAVVSVMALPSNSYYSGSSGCPKNTVAKSCTSECEKLKTCANPKPTGCSDTCVEGPLVCACVDGLLKTETGLCASVDICLQKLGKAVVKTVGKIVDKTVDKKVDKTVDKLLYTED